MRTGSRSAAIRRNHVTRSTEAVVVSLGATKAARLCASDLDCAKAEMARRSAMTHFPYQHACVGVPRLPPPPALDGGARTSPGRALPRPCRRRGPVPARPDARARRGTPRPSRHRLGTSRCARPPRSRRPGRPRRGGTEPRACSRPSPRGNGRRSNKPLTSTRLRRSRLGRQGDAACASSSGARGGAGPGGVGKRPKETREGRVATASPPQDQTGGQRPGSGGDPGAVASRDGEVEGLGLGGWQPRDAWRAGLGSERPVAGPFVP